MKIEKENADFEQYCQIMYNENCIERLECGQIPYKTFEDYLTKNYNFIVDRFKKGKRPWSL